MQETEKPKTKTATDADNFDINALCTNEACQTSRAEVLLKGCDFQLAESSDGLSACFTLRKGLSREVIMRAINTMSRERHGCNILNEEMISNDPNREKVAEKDLRFEVITVVTGSEGKSRNGTVGQGCCLRSLNLKWAEEETVAIVAGLFLLEKGGDLLQGKLVRTRSSAIARFKDGINSIYIDEDAGDCRIAAAGERI